MPSWFILSLCAVILLGIYAVATKILLNKGTDPLLFGGGMQLTTGLLGIVPAILSGFHLSFTPQLVGILFLDGIIYATGATLFYQGLAHVDLSESVIFEALSVFWGVLAGFILFGEPLTWQKLAAALLICLALLVIGVKRNVKVRLTKYEFYIIACTIFYAIGAFIDKKIVAASSPSTALVLTFTTAGSFMLLAHRRSVTTSWNTQKKDQSFLPKLIFISLVILIAYTMIFTAYGNGGEASRIFAVLQTQTILSSVFGIFLLKETGNIKAKLIAVALTFCGLLLMRG
jgi:drug/metabolite transporter (DMT)-like permease